MEISEQDDEKKFYDNDPDEAGQADNSEAQKIIDTYKVAVRKMSLQELMELFDQPATEPASLVLRAIVHGEIERRMRH